ncbi:MAG: SAM-dependent chlorinase/fluorinase [Dehalococcoidia bacterium]
MGSGIITLTTDFGYRDAYVGVMKGVILGINPEATIVDISHDIEPQNVFEAAYLIRTAYSCFPPDAIHVVIVDPGVGSNRKAIIVRTPRAYFVAPDNGVLSYVVDDMLEAIDITNPDFWLHPLSTTFHGRDIFAPVAAHLSVGISAKDFGEEISSLVELPALESEKLAEGTVVGRIIHIDRFGNLITSIKHNDLPAGDVYIEVKGYTIEGLSPSYVEGEGVLALIGSDGYLEISVPNGNASDFLKIVSGDLVKVGSTRPNT